MSADDAAQSQPARRGRRPGTKRTTAGRTRGKRLGGAELTQQLNEMVAELIKENRKLRRQVVTLTERRDRVQARGTLLSDVWAIDAEIASRTVDTHVKRLRDKLGTAGRFIETVRGVGYRFSETPSAEE